MANQIQLLSVKPDTGQAEIFDCSAGLLGHRRVGRLGNSQKFIPSRTILNKLHPRSKEGRGEHKSRRNRDAIVRHPEERSALSSNFRQAWIELAWECNNYYQPRDEKT